MSDAIVSKQTNEAPVNRTLFGGGPTIRRPTNAAKWFHYFDTNLGYDVIWNGVEWVVPAVGDAGTQAAQGHQGVRGNQGYQGLAGLAGQTGIQGSNGATGVGGMGGGTPGPQGRQGGRGLQGNYGPE